MQNKLIILKSSLVKKSIFLPLGIFVIILSYNIFERQAKIDFTVLSYLFVAFVFIVLAFEKEFFGIQRYLQLKDNRLIYKRFPFTAKTIIDVNDIEKITIKGLKIYIHTSNGDIHLVNPEWLTRYSQKEVLSFFENNFEDKIEKISQKDFFTERYERKIEKLKKEGKI